MKHREIERHERNEQHIAASTAYVEILLSMKMKMKSIVLGGIGKFQCAVITDEACWLKYVYCAEQSRRPLRSSAAAVAVAN